MHSTLKLRDSDPHDDFAIAPDVVPAAWADKVLADITRDAGSAAKRPPDIKRRSGIKNRISRDIRHPARLAVVAAPSVDTTFRATAVDDMPAADRTCFDQQVGENARSCWYLQWAALPQQQPGNTTAMQRKR